MNKAFLSGMICAALVAAVIVVPSATASAVEREQAAAIYAQRLADQTVKSNPDMLDVIFHVTPPNANDNMAIAAFTAKERGGKSGEDDLGVMTTGKPIVEVQKDGVRIGVLVPLKDHAGRTIGALGLMYPYHAGEKESAFLQRSEKIRDHLAKRIDSRESLFAK